MVQNMQISKKIICPRLAVRGMTMNVVILLCLAVWQEAKSATFINGMYYVLNSSKNTASLASATGEYGNFGGYAGDVTIPSTVEYQNVTYTVTGIQNRCFYNCKDITSISIPASITKIFGTEVFYGCTGIKRIILEDGDNPITIPGCVYSTQYGNTKATFHYAKLESIYVGRSIKMSSSSDSDSPFYGQSTLSDVVIGPKVTELPRGFIYGSAISNISFPEGITKIGDEAFAYLPNLNEIIFPNSLEEIGGGCCAGSSIERAFVGDNVKILERTFHSCPNLKTIYLGSGITSIGTNTFAWSNNLSKIYLFSENLTSINSPGFPDGLGQIFVTTPDRYKNIFPDKYLDKLIVFNNSANTYTGTLPTLNYQNYVENTCIVYSIPSEYINVGSYNINIPVSFKYKNWTSQTTVSVSYVIDPAQLMVIPQNVSRQFGVANPELTCSYFGFKNNETVSVLTKLPNVETTATKDSPVGVYPIIPSGAEAQNYTFTYERGSLTVTKADQTIEWEQQFGTVKVGDVIELTAISSADLPIKYTSSDEAVAEIFTQGSKKYVEFLKPGNVSLRATQDGNENYKEAERVSKTITVNPVEATILSISADNMSLLVGQTEKLTATVQPANTTDKTITWKSDNEAVATVSSDGTVTAVSVGTANITATCGKATATCKVTVNPVEATDVILSADNMSLLVGQTEKLTATVQPANTTDKTVTWKSDNEAVATVSSDGTVTAVSVGTANITATCGKATATCKVTVNPLEATGVILSADNMSLLVGQSEKLTATVEPDNTTDKTITWKSDNEAVATVSSDGTVTALSVGTANITATCGNATVTCKVTVNPVEATGVILSADNMSLLVGQTEKLTVTVLPDNTTDKTVTWKSDNEAVATVGSDGTVTAVSVGTANIMATCGQATATCKVTVNPVEATGVILSADNMSLLVGQTEKLTVTVKPDNTTDKTITWKSDNEAVATVSSDGTVTAVSVGIANITATCGKATATCKVTVNPVEATGVILSADNMSLLVGQTEKLTVTVEPDNTTDKTITWKSDNEAVATVSSDGTVTAVSVGTANIMATCGQATATCKVTVNPILIESITISPEFISEKEGQRIQLTVTILPEDATDKSLEWSSSDGSVASVSQSGIVQIHKIGYARITATAKDGSGVYGTCDVEGQSEIESILIDNDVKWDLYDMQGILVKSELSKNDIRHILPGFYILRSGNKVLKVKL